MVEHFEISAFSQSLNTSTGTRNTYVIKLAPKQASSLSVIAFRFRVCSTSAELQCFEIEHTYLYTTVVIKMCKMQQSK